MRCVTPSSWFLRMWSISASPGPSSLGSFARRFEIILCDYRLRQVPGLVYDKPFSEYSSMDEIGHGQILLHLNPRHGVSKLMRENGLA